MAEIVFVFELDVAQRHRGRPSTLAHWRSVIFSENR
jgi:hypothetical protein